MEGEKMEGKNENRKNHAFLKPAWRSATWQASGHVVGKKL